MKIFVLNCGSSSLKYQLFDMQDESVIASGKVERIGMEDAILTHEPTDKEEVKLVTEILDHTTAIEKVFDFLVDPKHGVIKNVTEIEAVGHRVVHGGEVFSDSVKVDGQVKAAIKGTFDLAPLHNPANLVGIEAVETVLPNVPNVAVFDTAFHQTMPQNAFMYALPRILYKKHKIRRYGFHGTSHKYVSMKAAEFLNKPLEQLKIVSCHIGNGASVTAVNKGQSIDTSMGMTPLEGLMMGTRSGDIDPAIIPFVMDKEDLTLNEVNSMLNKHSGLIGVSGIGSDMRDIEENMEKNEYAKLAFDMYEYRIRKYIGAYAAAMDGIDVLIFTAGVGENSNLLRKAITDHLSYLGVKIDDEINNTRSKQIRRISTPESKVEVLVVPTNEELMIARDTLRIVKSSK
ncbi:MAG: acetate/propionate family kinase [Tepidibacillus sp.]|uniref:acetate/propionate family kinase n=1 Tax=Tepidibacillus sp. HK-1 TaxID=1883407 RepID=UPI000852E830|nr:acetate kinase [Tepidibacillus sp. HK-1]GBF12172.1 acetate kinase [Tepidibacillus sp. HK-1]